MLQLMMLTALLLPAQQAEGKDLVLKVGDRAPELNCLLYETSLPAKPEWKDLKGQVVVLDFWATWCPPCIESVPHMNELVKEFAEKPVTFLSITYEPEHMIQPFLEKHPMKTTVGTDSNFKMFREFKAFGIPTVVIVDAKQEVAAVIHPTKLTADVINEVLSGKVPDVEQARGWPDPAGAEKYFRSLVRDAPGTTDRN